MDTNKTDERGETYLYTHTHTQTWKHKRKTELDVKWYIIWLQCSATNGQLQ